jgi:hypothetical protein
VCVGGDAGALDVLEAGRGGEVFEGGANEAVLDVGADGRVE